MIMNTYTHLLKSQISDLVEGVFAISWIKIPISILIGTIGYLIGPSNYQTVTALLVLIAFDFMTAIAAKYHIGEEIESRKILKSATKIFVYTLFVSAGNLAENIVPGTTSLDRMIVTFLALTELISIIENIGKMGYTTPQKILNLIVN